MTLKFAQWVPFTTCKHPFLAALKDKNSLPQCQQLNTFIEKHNITDINFQPGSADHDMIGLVVNEQYCSLDELKEHIIAASNRAQRFFYLAVNKFYIYSTEDLTVTTTDYDARLIKYCQDVVNDNFILLDHTVRPDDNGLLGNFIHPVTTMFFKRND